MLDQQNTPPKSATPNVFQIVGIGASARGLEAAGELLESLPPGLGLGDVLVRHLDPEHPSILAGLLAEPYADAGARSGGWHARRAGPCLRDPVEHELPDSARRGAAMPRAERYAPQLTVDYALRSLAQDRGSRAIGVLWRGSLSDRGTSG